MNTKKLITQAILLSLAMIFLGVSASISAGKPTEKNYPFIEIINTEDGGSSTEEIIKIDDVSEIRMSEESNFSWEGKIVTLHEGKAWIANLSPANEIAIDSELISAKNRGGVFSIEKKSENYEIKNISGLLEVTLKNQRYPEKNIKFSLAKKQVFEITDYEINLITGQDDSLEKSLLVKNQTSTLQKTDDYILKNYNLDNSLITEKVQKLSSFQRTHLPTTLARVIKITPKAQEDFWLNKVKEAIFSETGDLNSLFSDQNPYLNLAALKISEKSDLVSSAGMTPSNIVKIEKLQNANNLINQYLSRKDEDLDKKISTAISIASSMENIDANVSNKIWKEIEADISKNEFSLAKSWKTLFGEIQENPAKFSKEKALLYCNLHKNLNNQDETLDAIISDIALTESLIENNQEEAISSLLILRDFVAEANYPLDQSQKNKIAAIGQNLKNQISQNLENMHSSASENIFYESCFSNEERNRKTKIESEIQTGKIARPQSDIFSILQKIEEIEINFDDQENLKPSANPEEPKLPTIETSPETIESELKQPISLDENDNFEINQELSEEIKIELPSVEAT